MTKLESCLDPKHLIGLLREQRELYLRLRELSERQRNLISGDRPEMLLNILRDRQTLVLALSRINEELSPYRCDWERAYSELPPQTRTEASGLLDEINGTLQTILKIDQEDGALLSARKQAVAASLDELTNTRTASAAYARTNQTGHGADLSG